MNKLLLKLSFRGKILGILLIITFLLSGFSLLLVQSIEQIKYVSTKIEIDNIPEYVWLAHWEEEVNLKEYIVKNPLTKDECCSFLVDYITYSEEHKALGEKNGPIPASLYGFKRKLDSLDFLIINEVQGLLKFGNHEAAAKYLTTEYLPKLTILRDELVKEQEKTLSSLHGNTDLITVIIENSLWTLLFLTMGAIILSIIVSYSISAGLMKPIHTIIEKVDRIAKGEFGLTIKETTQIEMQRLTHSINQMSNRLRDSFEIIISDKMYREQIVNSLHVGIITIDNRNEEVSINFAAQHMLDIFGDRLEDLQNQSNKDENHTFWDILFCKKICQNVKVSFSKQGENKQLLVSQSELLDYQHKEVLGRIFHFIDITETEELERRIHQSEKLALVGEIAASAAHEIRNPLAVIHGFISLMNMSLSEQEKRQFQLELLIKEIERINAIIEEMLLQSKPGAPMLRKSYLEDIIKEILPLIAQNQGSERVNFTIDLVRLPLWVDSKQIKQVFHNLLRNSIEAMEGVGEISIYSTIQENSYEIHLCDNGPGIPSYLQDSIFDPFISSKEKGTGLGLTIVQRIIENHGGTIELIVNPHYRTSFIITLPLIKSFSN